MLRLFIWVALMIAVVAEGLALIRLSNGSRIADAQAAPDSSAIDDLSRRATALDRLAASLDARLRVIEDAQAGVKSKTDGITKLLSDLQPGPSTLKRSGNSKQKLSP